MLTAALKLLNSLVAFALDLARKAIDWFRRPGAMTKALFAALALWALLATFQSYRRGQTILVIRQQLASVQTTVKDVRQQGEANVKAAQAQCRADNAVAVSKAQAHARDVESKLAAAMAELAAKNSREKVDAKRNGDAVAAGIRAGTVQLRDEWGGAFNVPGLASGPGGQDDAAELRATGTGRLVEIADSCDADIRYWQGVWKAAGAVK